MEGLFSPTPLPPSPKQSARRTLLGALLLLGICLICFLKST